MSRRDQVKHLDLDAVAAEQEREALEIARRTLICCASEIRKLGHVERANQILADIAAIDARITSIEARPTMRMLELQQAADFLEVATIESTVNVGHTLVHSGRTEAGNRFTLMNDHHGNSALAESR
jgi:hypothetical protein